MEEEGGEEENGVYFNESKTGALHFKFRVIDLSLVL